MIHREVGAITPCLLILALLLSSYVSAVQKEVWIKSISPPKKKVHLEFGFSVLKLGGFYNDVFHPVSLVDEDYENTLEYLPSDGPADPQIRRFERSQYDPASARGKNLGAEGFSITPLIYSFAFHLNFDLHPVVSLVVENNLWWGNQTGSSFNKYFLLEPLDPNQFRGVASVDKQDTARLRAFQVGPVFIFRILPLRFFQIVPFFRVGLLAGSFFQLKNRSTIRMSVDFIESGGISPVQNNEGKFKDESEISDSRFFNHSVNEIIVEKTFERPWLLHTTWTMGLEYVLNNVLSTRLYVGFQWFAAGVNHVSVSVIRRHQSLVGEEEGMRTREIRAREPGFRHQSVGYVVGIQLSLKL